MDLKVGLKIPQLEGVSKRLSPSSMAHLHEEIAKELEETVRAHLIRYARQHHATAKRLGARPTGNLEDARFSHSSSDGSAVVSIGASGIRRALGPVTVTPRNAAALTIPIHAIAYGHRVREVERYHRVFRPRGKDYLAIQEKGKDGITPIYLLVKRAVLRHSPDMLPTGEEMAENCRAAAADYLLGGGDEA